MDFLVIGNGFDIAHNLPTKCAQFLKYCKEHTEKESVSEEENINEEFDLFVGTNIWLRYFLRLIGISLLNESDKTWIDFEKEVAEVIQLFEVHTFETVERIEIHCRSDRKNPNRISLELHGAYSPYKLEKFLSGFEGYERNTREYLFSAPKVTNADTFLEFIYLQLREFTRAFEIYCLKINQTAINEPIIFTERGRQVKQAEVERAACWQRYRDAEKRNGDNVNELKRLAGEADDRYYQLMSEIHPVDYLSMGRFAYVLSFNYTNTYERLYGDSKTKYCYIHGKAQENKNQTNLILGIDDNLSNGEESNNFQCVKFKKYYQRIIFKTGSEYKDWLAMGPKRLPDINYVHIVGHSLDRTDHDVLYEFFSDKRFRIVIYYYCPKDFEEKVQKVIQLLACKGGNGRDELISRVHGRNWTIKFIYLYDEKEGLFKEPVPMDNDIKETDT